RQIMENSENPEACEMRDQRLPCLKGGHDDIKHMVTLFAFGWDNREPHAVCLGPGSQLAQVGFPDFSPSRLNLIAVFEFCAEERRQQVRGQITRPNIDPGVLVGLAPEKSAPVCSLFPKDLGPLIQVRIVDQQRATFSTGEILGFMETERCKLSKSAEVSSAV